ncbi:MAG: signal recognition particle protein [Chlamydiia bacterium]|nr:signal recognition particle protein [Chlamydiia bacterium]
MLGALTEKMHGLVQKITGKKQLTEENITEAMSEVRVALLEADVNYGVVKALVKRVKEKALGDTVLKSVTPGQQFIKVVHDELVALMGGEEAKLELSKSPAVIMMCGLQGSGKTTTSAKLVRYLMKKEGKKKPLLAACDLQRPAAIEQLHTLGKDLGVEVFSVPNEKDPVKVAQAARQKAIQEGFDVLIVDTAGRLHVDDELMKQLEQVKAAVKPDEVLFVANATTGQDAVEVATRFNERIQVTGSVLTMLDGNARGGAAISIREVTGKPLKFEGVGEKVEDLQLFNPGSMADRILGMGDTINLVRKAEEHFDEAEAKSMEEKLRKSTFSYEDYLKQIQSFKKMGPLKSLISMLPGASQFKDMEFDDKEIGKVEAIIQSMTKNERCEKVDLLPSRRHRIAKGSGTNIDDVNRLVKSFTRSKQFFKNMPNMKQLEKMMGGSKWR